MSAIISISILCSDYQDPSWFETIGHTPTPEHIACLIAVLSEMRSGRRVDNYDSYCPLMNLGSHPPNRKIIGETLYFLWNYCQAEMLPELNYLIINKHTRLPGKAMLATWIEKYGNEKGYARYCNVRAYEAKTFLDNGWLMICP